MGAFAASRAETKLVISTIVLRWGATFLLACCPCIVLAHSLSIAYVDVTVGNHGNDIRLELDLSVRDIALALPLDRDRNHAVTWGELLVAKPSLEALIEAGLGVDSAAGSCNLRQTGFGIRRYEDGVHGVVEMVAICPSNQALTLEYRLLSGVDQQHRALITLHSEGRTTTAIATADNPRVAISSAPPPFLTFFREGVHHILIGYDHLAFLLSLLLPAVLLRVGGRWQPADSLRTCIRQVVATVTAFTLAHSVTLGLAAFDLVVPATQWVEALIAASVILAALNNVYPVVTRRLWIVGFGFGLIHGFGFAGALSELGIPDGARLWALLGFNLGVEAGQLLVIAVAVPVLYLFGRRQWYAKILLPVGSIGIVCAAVWWLAERLR